MAKRIDWHTVPIVIVPRRECPHCGSEKHIQQDRRQENDGSLWLFQICKRCSKPFRFLEVDPDEILDSGIQQDWLTYDPPND